MTAPLPAPADRLEALFDAHAEELCRLVQRLTGSRQVAEEVVQEAFLTAWKRREDLDGIDNLKGWLYRVTLNHVRHRRRSFARLRRFLERYTSRPEPVPQSLPDEQVERLERARRVHATLARLTPTQREAFVLYELQQLSGQEAADVLGIKTNTFWGRLRIARASFEKAWTEAEGR